MFGGIPVGGIEAGNFWQLDRDYGDKQQINDGNVPIQCAENTRHFIKKTAVKCMS